jgi:uncharacterized membrane protein HdeD (DUF308 family)
MNTILDRWWLVALRGVAAIIFGILTFTAPLASLLALVLVFGVYAVIDGVLYLAAATRGAGKGRSWAWYFFAGLMSIGAGVVTFLWPGISALALLFVIAAWSIATGIASILAAVHLRREIQGEWLLALSGVLSIAFGVLLIVFPRAGALAVLWWIGAYAIVLGGVLVALGFRMRSIRARHERTAPTGAVPTAA